MTRDSAGVPCSICLNRGTVGQGSASNCLGLTRRVRTMDFLLAKELTGIGIDPVTMTRVQHLRSVDVMLGRESENSWRISVR